MGLNSTAILFPCLWNCVNGWKMTMSAHILNSLPPCDSSSQTHYCYLFYICLYILMSGLFLNNEFFPSLDVKWWTGVVWIACWLLWCVYQLFGLSLWWHPFTTQDPLVKKWCNAKFLQISLNEEINSSMFWMAWVWLNYQHISFWVNFSFKLLVSPRVKGGVYFQN